MKKIITLQQLVLALLLTAYCLLPNGANAQTTHEWKGGEEVIPVGAAPPGPIQFKNKSKTDFYDFTIVIESQNGNPLNFSIDTVTIDGKTYNETHNTGSFVRIEADTNANGAYKNSEKLPKSSSATRTIRVTLTSHPTVPYNIRIQPTSYTASAVMVSAFGQNFGPCGTYLTQFPVEAVLANTYEGLVMGDVNTTGVPLTQMLIMPQGPFFITDAILLDAQGIPIPGGMYSPSGGMLTFPQPVLPGDTFGIQMIPDGLIPNQPMMVQMCLDLPPFQEPFMQISGISLLDMQAPFNTGMTTTGELRFQYETPLTHSLKYLNILYQPVSFGDTNIYWIGQNICLEHFNDTMELSMQFDMLPGATALPPSAPLICDLAVFVTDTIYTDPTSFGPAFFSPYSFGTKEVSYGANLPTAEELSMPLPSGVTLPPLRWRRENSKGVLIGCNMVNIELDSLRYRGGEGGPYVPNDYAGDWNACGPVATANSFSWLRSIHPDIETKLGAAFGQGDSAQRKMLAEFSAMMERADEQGVHMFDFIEAKLEFIDKYKLPMRVTYQSVFSDSTIASPNDCYGHKAENSSVNPPNPAPYGKISPDWVFDRVDENCDTELFIMWRKDTLNATTGQRDTVYGGGHYITVTGVRENNGNWRLRWKDDEHQERPGGLRHGISDMRVGPEGVIWVPGLDEGDWECFVKDAIVECYDSTVTFNATKGRAFEDGNGSGTQEPGEAGVPGATVRLIDANTGVVVGETTTGEDGSYLFHDLSPGDYYVEFSNLPPGYDFSAQNVGTNDSIDSDVNALGITPTFTLNDNAQGHTDAGLVPNRIVRITPTVWLQAEVDPITALMLTTSFEQGAMPQLGDHYTNGLTFLPYRKDSMETEKLTENPVDWILVELRSGSDSTVTVAVLPALVMPDGEIRAADNTILSFHGVDPGNYYVVIHHRNALAMMTLMPIYLDHAATSIDFTSPSLPIYGTDSRTLISGKMVMTGGDGNNDGVINAADRSGTWNFRNAVGYLPWDINFDGVVNAADRSATWNNRNKQQELP